MSRLRQLPKLFLRGSLANETMRNLTPEQKEEVQKVVSLVANSQELLPHKIEFINQLSHTIGGDYRDDRGMRSGPYGTAEQEYNIIIWKATVFLLYHSDYQYKCTACESNHYHNNRNKKVLFNRKFPVCPNCKNVIISNPGSTSLKKGSIIQHSQYMAISTTADAAPEAVSAISTISGDTKIGDPYAIINDPIQRKKYYGEHVWGYFRQILKENEIRKHRTVEMVMLPADQLAVQELLNLLDNHKIYRLYYQSNSPDNGFYRISVNTLSIPLELSVDFSALCAKYHKAGVNIDIDHKTILVKAYHNAPLMKSNLKNATPVTMISNSPAGNDDLEFIDILADNETQPEKSYDMFDVLSKIKSMLPEDCKSLFDILTNTGPIWTRFSAQYGDGAAKSAHISRFLNVSTKQITAWKSQIRVLMHNYGLTPAHVG